MSLAISSKGKGKKRKTNTRVWFWVDECRYSVIIDNVKGLGWKLVDEERNESKSNMYWIDVAAIHERFRSIQAWQTINHFPGMPNIARKNRMGQNLNRMLKMFPREYSFYPRTWVLPGELADFRAQFDNQGNSIGNKIYIIKPDTGCQGRGIFLTRTYDLVPQHENVVAQLYISKPLLLDGYKFDLRIYCLVSSVKPLRMYLFHDGLVRMCTEEYVKPTKQNISNTCMHLTNYAVNKHNSNFQQPSAKSSSGNQDEGSKRSVSWFINYIREQRGDVKADWLWNRIGILCVRTVLSIIPTLSREYDQHFRSFGGIPYVCPSANPDRAYGGGGNVSRSSSKASARSRSNSAPARKSSTSRAKSKDEEDEEADEEEEDEDEEDEEPGSSRTVSRGRSETKEKEEEDREVEGEESREGEGEPSEPEPKMPSIRGSRCFEILGFDVMVDSKLQPWLIEVNHLPSFGTDSPLDLDIKERLMYQTLRSLAVLPDDEQAYLQHHKAEAEKRLMARREKDKEERQMEIAGILGRDKPTPRQAAKKPQATSRVLGPQERDREVGAAVPLAEIERCQSSDAVETSDDSIVREREREREREAYSGAGAGTGTASAAETPEECSAQRVAEIRSILLEIYAEYSIEKVPKIDRLLGKYTGREEEFLRFVYQKYNITPPRSPANYRAVIDAASDAALSSAIRTDAAKDREVEKDVDTRNQSSAAADSTTDVSSGSVGSSRSSSASTQRGAKGAAQALSLVEEAEDDDKEEEEQSPGAGSQSCPRVSLGFRSSSTGDIGVSTVCRSSARHNPDNPPPSLVQPASPRHQLLQQIQRVDVQREGRTSNVSGRGGMRGFSPSHNGRSQSPPAPRRALASNWKSTADEDLAYRAEVLQTHFPSEQDEWMQYEMRSLKEFSRIFPPEKRIVEKAYGEDPEGDEDTEDDDDEAPTPTASARPYPVASLPPKHPITLSGANNAAAAAAGAPIASYEEIIYQVFLQDKRSAMRLHNPLPNRAIVRADSNPDASTLPPLEHPHRPQIGTMAAQAGKGLGWRAPAAKQPDRRDTLRNPTQTQVDSAKRLSQGLSVSLSYNPVKEAGTGAGAGGAPGSANTGVGIYRQQGGVPAVVILDQEFHQDQEYHPGPQSYYQQQQTQYQFQHPHQQPHTHTHTHTHGQGAGFQGQGQGPNQGAGLIPGPGIVLEGESAWSKRSSRLLEESRIARMRIEAAKHPGTAQPYTPAVVLRQQVFAFDARGGPFSSSPLAPGGNEHNVAQSKAVIGVGIGGGAGMGVLRYPVQPVGRALSAHDSNNNSGKR